MKKIPTVGDTVVFYPTSMDIDIEVLTNGKDPKEGCAAIVTAVYEGSMVNLTVFPDQSFPVFKSSIAEKGSPAYETAEGYYWDWVKTV